jgi:ribosomal-protein-alanine N-acetyltransferase
MAGGGNWFFRHSRENFSTELRFQESAEAFTIIRIETERLLLEPFRTSDTNDLFDWASDTESTKYMGWKRHETVADFEAVIQYFEKVNESEPPKFDRPVVLRDNKSGRPLGSAGIHQVAEQAVELGWILRPAARRQGFAQEAAVGLLKFAMEDLPWVRRVEARAHPDNASSIRLMLKLGMYPLGDVYCKMPQLNNAVTRLVHFGIEKS